MAVLGILLMNIVGFSWPEVAVLSPRAVPGPHGAADEAVFLVEAILIEGKLRGLFSLLFGAGMVLMRERAAAAGIEGTGLQQRRLAWLAVFGLAHFYLLWWGDILFLYAVCGFLVLGATAWSVRRLVIVALALYAAGVAWLASLTLGDALPWLGGTAAEQADAAARMDRLFAVQARAETEATLGPWTGKVAHQLAQHYDWPLNTVIANGLETVPLMLLGMALLRSGLLAGAWPRRRTLLLAAGATAAGLAATVPPVLWLASAGYPLPLARLSSAALTAPGRLAMTAGYAAALVLIAPYAVRTALGARLVAAGRMAFSNYIGTSLVMTALFHGWGLGLFGRFDRLELLGFVALGWLLMLGWSKPWLARFRQGPLEWAWRSLLHRQRVPLRRLANATDSH